MNRSTIRIIIIIIIIIRVIIIIIIIWKYGDSRRPFEIWIGGNGQQ